MLERLGGPQTAAAMVLFGEVLGGEQAAARGLAWSCVPETELLDAATTLAAQASAAPRELVARVKTTLASVPWLTSLDHAVDTELEAQTWSFGRDWFSGGSRPRR